MLFSEKDLKKLLIPLFLEQALAMMIGMFDTVMVSGCGEAAVSGVSLVDSISILLIGLFSAMATGGAVVVSQFLGMKDTRNAEDASRQLFYVLALVSGLMTLFSLTFRSQLLQLVFGSIDDDVMRNAEIYFFITALSYPALAIYNGSAALLRAQGDSKASFNASVIMNFTNVTGNALLIYVFKLGVAGAALATLVSRLVGMVFIFHVMNRPKCVIHVPAIFPLRWNAQLTGKILRIGVPNGLESSLFQFGKLALLSLVSTFGTASIAANAVSNTLCSIQVIPGNAVSLAMITVVGQCVGANEYDQARYYTRKLLKTAYILLGLFCAVMAVFVDTVLLPFNLSPETLDIARTLVLMHAIGGIFLWPLSFVLPNTLRAAGDAKYTMLVSISSMFLFRLVSGYILAVSFHMGVIGVWLAMQIDWIVRITFFVLRYRGHAWEMKSLVRDSKQ